jgi:hypothetical protein
MPKPRTVFISSSRDMTHWAALAIAHVRRFAVRHGLTDLDVLDYRDIDPAEIDHVESWQDSVGAPSRRTDTALTLVLFGERIGTPLPSSFRLKQDIHARLRRDGHDWVHVAGLSESPIGHGQVPLTGTLFEYFDACLDRADGSRPGPLRVVFKGTFDGAGEPNFGNGEFRAQIEASDVTNRHKRQLRREYEDQLDWLIQFWVKRYGLQQHPQLFCRDEDAFLAELEPALAEVFLAHGERVPGLSGPRIDPLRVELPGPAPYDLDRAFFFLGRGPQVAELGRRALHHHASRRLVPVIGDSGAGKSSLLRAGLLNDARSASRGREGWRAAFLSLAERPMATEPLLFLAEALADPAALHELGDKEVLRQRLSGITPMDAAQRLLEILAVLTISPPPGHGAPRLLLVVGQLELALDGARLETPAAAAWQAFLHVIAAMGDGLLELAARDQLDPPARRVADSLPCTVVVGLPADRLGALEAMLRPGDLIFPLPRLVDDTGLREVITETFARLGLRIEPLALETLCHDAIGLAADTAGSILPLLSVTLAALHADWKQRRGAGGAMVTGGLGSDDLLSAHPEFDIRSKDVAAHGRLELAIERLGELAWAAVDTEEAGIARALQSLPVSQPKLRAQSGEISMLDMALSRLLRRLVVVAPDPLAIPDRLVGLSDADLDEVARPLAQALRDHRIVTQRGDGTWWLVHLAVLHSWSRGASWRAAEAEAYRTVANLRSDYSRWQEESTAGESDAQRWLWTRPREVKRALDWMALHGLDDNAELVAFAKAGMLVAASRDTSRAGQILRGAAWFNDLNWCSEVLIAAADKAEAACNTWSDDASALLNASQHGNLELVRILLRYGARPTPSPAMGWTALHGAATAGAPTVIDLLLIAKHAGALQRAAEFCCDTLAYRRLAEDAYRDSAHRDRHALAIAVELREARRPNVSPRVHFHAVDVGEEIVTPQTIEMYGFVQTTGHSVPRSTGIEMSDFTAPVQ